VDERTYDLGNTPGTVTIDYDMKSIEDALEVYYDGRLIASTGGPVKHSEGGPLRFYYQPGPGKPTYVKVIVRAPNEGTEWTYTISCPQ
jgi:hypothetical protein